MTSTMTEREEEDDDGDRECQAQWRLEKHGDAGNADGVHRCHNRLGAGVVADGHPGANSRFVDAGLL